MVSKNCGARELVENNKMGFWFDPYSKEELQKKIINICNKDVLEIMRKNVHEYKINKKDEFQINAYHVLNISVSIQQHIGEKLISGIK